MAAIYTFVGGGSAQQEMRSVKIASGVIALGQSGIFLPSEVQSLSASGITLVAGPAQSPASELTATGDAGGASGTLSGTYRYMVTFVTAAGETTPGPEMLVTVASRKVVLASIPVGSSNSGVIARNIYRSPANGGVGTERFLITIEDNTTTFIIDDAADSSLGELFPTVDTSAVMPVGMTDLAEFMSLSPTARNEAISLIARESGDESGGDTPPTPPSPGGNLNAIAVGLLLGA